MASEKKPASPAAKKKSATKKKAADASPRNVQERRCVKRSAELSMVHYFKSFKGHLKTLDPYLPPHSSYEVRILGKDKRTTIATIFLDTDEPAVDIKKMSDEDDKRAKEIFSALKDQYKAGKRKLLSEEEANKTFDTIHKESLEHLRLLSLK